MSKDERYHEVRAIIERLLEVAANASASIADPKLRDWETAAAAHRWYTGEIEPLLAQISGRKTSTCPLCFSGEYEIAADATTQGREIKYTCGHRLKCSSWGGY